jgi:hypothetical protein
LGVLPLASKFVTADALFTHRNFCASVLAGGGDYLLPIKENQPTLHAGIEAAFTPPAGLSPPPMSARKQSVEMDTAVDKGHGRRKRRAVMTTWLNDYLGWSELGQVFVL